jgi:putative transposase
MARPLRLEYPGALWHITARGTNGCAIFHDDEDRLHFLALLEEVVGHCNWDLHAWTLMDNHFHLLVETPEPTLSKGMHRLNQNHAQRFNWRHERRGHLFGERFHSKLVEKESYLLQCARYVVLNPVRAGMVERPEQYRWSSYRAMAGYEEAPPWLTTTLLEMFDGEDRERAQAEYRAFVEAKVGVEDRLWDNLVGQVYLGGVEFIQRVQKMIESKPRSSEHPRPQREVGRPPMSAMMTVVCEKLGLTPEEVRERRGDLSRMVIAHLGVREGLKTLRVIAHTLGLRSLGHISNLAKRCEAECRKNATLRAIVDDCITAARAHAPPLPEHYRAWQPIDPTSRTG